MTTGVSDFKLLYQRSPIFFVGGVAAHVSGGMASIAFIINPQAGDITNLDDDKAYFDFYPEPGSHLAQFQLGKFPYANQSVAANAIIADPITLSMRMEARARPGNGGYAQRGYIFTTLQSTILLHASLGGTYSIATPSFIYTDCVLLDLRDVSQGDPKYPQSTWMWDFEQPLLSLQAAGQAQNTLTSKLSAGSKVTPDSSGAISTNSPQVSPNNGPSPTTPYPSTGPAGT